MQIKRLLISVSALTGVAGIAYYYISRKTSGISFGSESRKLKASSAKPSAALAKPGNVKEGSYSFISGFRDAATVEVTLSFDADKFSFSVREDEFLSESGDSHVGVLYGEDFSAQFEYASYYSGEDYPKLLKSLAEKHRDLSEVSYGAQNGAMFRHGDNLCMVFPIPEDSCSYLLVTLVKAAGNDDELEALPAYPDVNYILGSMRFSRS